ncbi:MAG TPA: hypothetical protein VFI84_02850 [Candidatus Saccharimonadales bacterium]|nr:hypothetical protein [Candidatus Saccharimonadales bacterium]
MTLLKNTWFVLGTGVLVGVLAILGIRFTTYKPVQVHYHANFAVYIDGRREEFKGAQYYQEVAVCSTTNDITTPLERAHMHDHLNSVIHVHDHAVTWGQFFENLGWYIGPDFMETVDGHLYQTSGDAQLHIILDGQDFTGLTPITNTVIKDRSRLLVSFGNVNNATLQQEYKSVPSTAKHYDETKDPASCAGSEKVTVSERLHHLF